jgi:hypothetical protein
MAVESNPFAIEALTYNAEIARRAIYMMLARGATIGSVAGGLVGATDCQLTAGSGMAVDVSAGEAVVPGSTSATQSGYYARVSSSSVLSIAASDPTNPRVDRISLVVKDAAYSGAANELVLAVETGTPTSGATLANKETHGVAAAPASSLTLGFCLVPTKAASIVSGDIENVAARVELPSGIVTPTTLDAALLTVLERALPPFTARSASFTASPGEHALSSGTVTATLPSAPEVNDIIGIWCGSGETTITATGNKIYGDFVTGATTIKLAIYQHVILQLDPAGQWVIIAGEPKREQKWSAALGRVVGTEYEPSATRTVQVMVSAEAEDGEFPSLKVGGVTLPGHRAPGAAGTITGSTWTFDCPPGQKWVVVNAKDGIASSYLEK